jgi:hypothetical protein
VYALVASVLAMFIAELISPIEKAPGWITIDQRVGMRIGRTDSGFVNQ